MAEVMTRCCLCGRFMDDDQVLLGFTRYTDSGEEYAHSQCVEAHQKKLADLASKCPANKHEKLDTEKDEGQ